jgi:hypothetical protein
MARSFADVTGEIADRSFKQRQLRMQNQNDELDRASKMASLQESGYTIKEQPRSFFGGGGMTLERDPSFVGAKTLEREKSGLEIEKLRQDMEDSKATRQLIMGDQQASGGDVGTPSVAGSPPWKPRSLKFGGVEFAAPAQLNPLQEAKLREMEAKEQELKKVDQAKSDNLRESAGKSLAAVKVAKEGSKYFGMTGDAPSLPWALAGQYGERKNWESNVNMLLSQKVLETINEMKNQSKTGSTGFGSMNPQELDVLKNAATALKKGLAPEDALRYLNEMESIYQKVVSGGQASASPTSSGDASQQPTEDDIAFTMQKYGMTREQVIKELGNA